MTGRRTMVVGSALAGGLVLAGCTQPEAPTVAPASSSSTTASASTSSEPARTLQVGQCLGEKPDMNTVDCSARHTYEVSAVVQDATAAGDLIKRGKHLEKLCRGKAAEYYGSPSFLATRLASGSVPSQVNPQADSRVVCVVMQDDAKLEKADNAVVGSLKGVLASGDLGQWRLCVKERVSQIGAVSFIPCSQPHASETVSARVTGSATIPYPGGDKVNALALAYCRPQVEKYIGARRPDVVPAQNSGTAEAWREGTMITACFAEVTTGTVKREVKGIKNAPLEAYR